MDVEVIRELSGVIFVVVYLLVLFTLVLWNN